MSACATPGHLFWARDLSRPEGVGAEFAAFLAKENVCIEHYIHSAGVFGLQLARAHDMAFVARIFNVNLFSAIELIRTLTQRKSNSGALRTYYDYLLRWNPGWRSPANMSMPRAKAP